MAVQLRRETWQSIWPEARGLAKAHFDEVETGIIPNRGHEVDSEAMEFAENNGLMRVYTARDSQGRLIGYLTWEIQSDPESKGLKIAEQGAWFVEPGHPSAAFKLFIFSIDDLRRIGVQCIYPHHRLMGRGAKLGRFFTWLGAKPEKQVYVLWIGEKKDA